MLDFDNIFGTISASCDRSGCNYTEDFEGFDGHCDLENTIKEMKENGWKNRYVNGDWEHICPGCNN